MYNISTAVRNHSALIVGVATVLKENFSYWRQFLAAHSTKTKSKFHYPPHRAPFLFFDFFPLANLLLR